MFELYNNDNIIPKSKYDEIYRIIVDNFFDRNKVLVAKRDEIDTKEKYDHWVNTILNTKDYNILIYYDENMIIGFAAYRYIDDYLCLSEVQFNANYKNKGYLRELLKNVIIRTDKDRYNKIFATTKKDNILAQQVLNHIGFVNTENNRYEIECTDLLNWINKKTLTNS